jgi:hypothetical protein
MTRSVSELAKCFTSLSVRINTGWSPHYAVGTTLRKTIGTSAPALAPQDAIDLADSISDRILDFAADGNSAETVTTDYWDSLGSQADQIEFSTITSDPVNTTRSTFDFLLFVASVLPTRPADVDWDRVKNSTQIPKQLATRLRGLEARLTDLEPRASVVDDKISVIEAAHDAAERLPTDLEELKTSSDKIIALSEASAKADLRISDFLKKSSDHFAAIETHRNEAAALVKKCDEAYRITTSAGLAGAFEYRSKSLANVGWIWVVILIVSLVAAVLLGKNRYDGLNVLLVGEHAPALVYLNILFAILGVAAPVWLAWLATRSIGQSFRLSEDYAFKASVSKAYEGYRKEAVSLDPEFAKRLFGSALNRLDEAPSRFIVSEDHNTPIQDLLENESMKKFFAAFPDVQEKFGRFIVDAKSAVGGAVAGAVAAAKLSDQTPGKPSQHGTEPTDS